MRVHGSNTSSEYSTPECQESVPIQCSMRTLSKALLIKRVQVQLLNITSNKFAEKYFIIADCYALIGWFHQLKFPD